MARRALNSADAGNPGGEAVFKRGFDIICGSLLALVALPLLIVLAVALAVSLRAWPIFVHVRVGRNGRRFRCVKLRTLPRGTAQYAPKPDLAHVQTTRLSRSVRRKHLDELPQLFLVPLGRMSLVGPRPEMPNLRESFDVDFLTARESVRPGCTGLWQVSVDSHLLISQARQYDLFYVEHAGMRLDLWILWRTIRLILSSEQVRLDGVPPWACRPSASGERLVTDGSRTVGSPASAGRA